VVGYPNFFGVIEDLAAIKSVAAEAGAQVIAVTSEPLALALLKPPGEFGVDIAVGEGQSLGVPMNLGGPAFGFFACQKKFVRNIPGRLVGETVDSAGRRGYVLTLATREQHIRREKATSNICTNEGLIALAATIYLETMGKKGVQEAARQCAQKANYTARRIKEIAGFSLPYAAPVFNEFVVRGPIEAKGLLTRLAQEREIDGGIELSRFYPDRPNDFLVCVTETNTRAQIDALVEGLKTISKLST